MIRRRAVTLNDMLREWLAGRDSGADNATVPEDAPRQKPIELAPKASARPPRVGGEVVLRPEADGAIDALLADVYLHASNCVRAFGDFHVAIGATPGVETALVRLLYDLNYRDFPWSRTRLWMTQECGVAGKGVCWPVLEGTVVAQSGMPAEQAHRIDISAAEPAADYERQLREHLGWRPKGHDRLDLVLAAIDEDGSLPWATQHAADDGALCVTWTGADGQGRTGMTPFVVSACRCVCVLAVGSGVRGALTRLEAALRGGPAAPGQSLRTIGGDVRWYMDYEACPSYCAGGSPDRGVGTSERTG
ncbi:MAG: hypothetical protein DYG92_00625 [Leptolyngbya sp. PLA1]|nr:hypothetical protein [Leptolyngbya sp. PLA1]